MGIHRRRNLLLANGSPNWVSANQWGCAACLGDEMSPGFIECVQGRFTQGVDEVEKVGEQVDGACVLIVVVTLLLIMEHCIACGTGSQTIAGIRIEEAVGGDYEIGIVGRNIHGDEIGFRFHVPPPPLCVPRSW